MNVIRKLEQTPPLQEQVEAALNDSHENLFSTLAQNSPDCIKLFDSEGKLLFINTGGLKEHGYATIGDALLGFKMSDVLMPESKVLFNEGFASALHGEGVSIEVQHTKEGANREFCLETLTPIRDGGPGVIGVLGVSRDITERKKKEKELQEKVDELKKANNLMVGRELRMIELKNEIKALRERVSPS